MNDFWFYCDCLIEVVYSFQYLGLKLSYIGKFPCAQQDLASRGLKAMYALRINVSQLFDPDVNMLINFEVYSLMYVNVTRNAMLENCASLIRKLLCSTGCNEVWLQQGV